MEMNRNISIRIIVSLICILGAITPAFSQSAVTILDKVVTKLKNSKSVQCSFSVEGNGSSAINGSLIASGNNFRLESPAGTTWHDGKSMWTSNNSTKEITIVEPSAAEIRETNPFAYLDQYKREFVLFFSRRKDPSHHLVLLNPRFKNSDIKAIEIAVNKKTMLPDRFIIRDRNDKVSTITINSLNLGSNVKANEFVCPVSSMKGYEIIDMR